MWGDIHGQKAILHIDGDAFFASCEVATNPALRGKPVVTGKERGIASSMSYEAKAKGVKRGMTISEIKRVCPDAIILPSDYETYSIFSQRMYNIVRRYTSEVEEYSIDECFADLTGLRRSLKMTYEQMAENIKKELDNELGMTFSIGLAPNKVLAKLASKWKKPSGLTIILPNEIENYTKKLLVGKIWGIGPQTSAYLNKHGIITAFDFANKNPDWVIEHTAKPFVEIWHELRGDFIYPLNLEIKHDYQSISKTKTFTPPSTDRQFIYSQLSKNVENACIKMRRHGLATKRIFFFLKTQDFHYHSLELDLLHITSAPQEILSEICNKFDKVYHKDILYRATGVVLIDLVDCNNVQLDLFCGSQKNDKWRDIYFQIDKIDEKFGKHSVFLGSSMQAINGVQYRGDRADFAKRRSNLFRGENKRQRLGIPMLGEVTDVTHPDKLQN
jgi:DNA polymerase-4/DNA polymerase V